MRRSRLIIAFAILAVAGCSAIPPLDTVDSLTRPSVTNDGAGAVVKHYNETLSAANTQRSDKLIATIQTDDLLRQTEAAYKISRFMKKPVAQVTPFVAGSIGAPQYGSYPMKFVVAGNHRLGVWERSSAGAPWRTTFAVPASIPAPGVAGLEEVAPTAAAGLAESPSVAAAKFADLLTVGAKSPYAPLFTVAPEVATMQKNLATDHAAAGHNQVLAITNTFTLNAPPTAFRTTTGEVIAFFTLTNADEMRPQFGAMWPVGQDTATFSEPNHLYRTALTTTLLHQFAIAIPTAGRAKIQVLGFTTQMVDSGGY